jgi:hypothetical protein
MYPPLARQTRMSGKIMLTVTIDEAGFVKDVEASTDNPILKRVCTLQQSAAENMRHWTFEKPPSAPYKETILYDYEFDESLPGEDGTASFPRITRVNYDLPDRVSIVSNSPFLNP